MKRTCKTCRYWYASTYADQCNIPIQPPIDKDFHRAVHGEEPPLVDQDALKWIEERQGREPIRHAYAFKLVYGHPSKLNKDNDCIFWTDNTPWWRRLFLGRRS